MLLPLISKLLNQTVTVEAWLGADYEGSPTYGDPVVVPARVEITPSRTLGTDGSEIPSYATIYTTAQIGVQDRITLPDGTVRSVLSVAQLPGGDGMFSHSEVKV